MAATGRFHKYHSVTAAKQTVDEILAGLDAVTPGEWHFTEKFEIAYTSDAVDSTYGMSCPIANVSGENREADAAHIALCSAMRLRPVLEDFNQMIDRIAELEAELDMMRLR